MGLRSIAERPGALGPGLVPTASADADYYQGRHAGFDTAGSLESSLVPRGPSACLPSCSGGGGSAVAVSACRRRPSETAVQPSLQSMHDLAGGDGAAGPPLSEPPSPAASFFEDGGRVAWPTSRLDALRADLVSVAAGSSERILAAFAKVCAPQEHRRTTGAPHASPYLPNRRTTCLTTG